MLHRQKVGGWGHMPGPLVIREGLAVQSFENSSPQSSPCIVSLTGGNMHVNIQYQLL